MLGTQADQNGRAPPSSKKPPCVISGRAKAITTSRRRICQEYVDKAQRRRPIRKQLIQELRRVWSRRQRCIAMLPPVLEKKPDQSSAFGASKRTNIRTEPNRVLYSTSKRRAWRNQDASQAHNSICGRFDEDQTSVANQASSVFKTPFNSNRG